MGSTPEATGAAVLETSITTAGSSITTAGSSSAVARSSSAAAALDCMALLRSQSLAARATKAGLYHRRTEDYPGTNRRPLRDCSGVRAGVRLDAKARFVQLRSTPRRKWANRLNSQLTVSDLVNKAGRRAAGRRHQMTH